MYTEPTKILDESRNERIDLFIQNLKSRSKCVIVNSLINGTYIKGPKHSDADRKNYYKYTIKNTISYESRLTIKFKIDGKIYELYKNKNNFHLIDVPDINELSHSFIKDFECSELFSIVFYYFYTIFSDMVNRNIDFTVNDYVLNPLLSEFAKPDGDLKVTISLLPINTKVINNKHLYISIFGDMNK